MTGNVARALVFVSSLFAVGCEGGTETGNPPFDAKLSYAAYSSRPDVVAVGGGVAPFEVSALWITVGNLSFVMRGTCGAAQRETHSGPGLATDNRATTDPSTERFEMYAGSYCEVDVPFEPAPTALPASAPAELAGHALMIEATLADGTTVSLLDDAPVLVLTPVTGDIAMHAAEPNLLVALDVAKWFDGFDLSGAARDGSVVRITKDENPTLLQRFEARLPTGVALFRDADGDGRIDPGSVPIAIAR